MAMNIMSPRSSVTDYLSWDRPANPDELPELQYCSDVMWGYWARDNPNIKNLRVYGTQDVVNEDTVLLVTRAMKNRGKTELEAWPGVEFTFGIDEFKALVGMYRVFPLLEHANFPPLQAPPLAQLLHTCLWLTKQSLASSGSPR